MDCVEIIFEKPPASPVWVRLIKNGWTVSRYAAITNYDDDTCDIDWIIGQMGHDPGVDWDWIGPGRHIDDDGLGGDLLSD